MFKEDYLDLEYFGWLQGNSPIHCNNHLQVVHKFFRNRLRSEIQPLLPFEETKDLDTDVKVLPIKREKPLPCYEEDRPSSVPIDDVKRVTTAQDEENNLIIGLGLRYSWAYEDLYETEFSKIKALVLKNSGSIEDAKDVFQESVIILVEKLSKKGFKFNSRVSTYLYSVSSYLWMNELRSRSLHTDKLEQLYDTCDVYMMDYNFDSALEESLLSKLSYLGEACLALLEYYYYKNWEWKDIAAQLGYSTAASARNQKFKCLKKVIR